MPWAQSIVSRKPGPSRGYQRRAVGNPTTEESIELPNFPAIYLKLCATGSHSAMQLFIS